MGHRKFSAPRRGSLAFSPRKRAGGIFPRVRYWPSRAEAPRLLGFMGYKVGMVTVHAVDDIPGSPTQGTVVAMGGTIVATPPMTVIGVAVYKRENGALVEAARHITKELPREVADRLRGVSATHIGLDELRAKLQDTHQVRAVVASVPRDAGLSQKKPHILTIPVSGSPEEAFNYVVSKLGKKVGVEEVFTAGSFIDVVGVTRGQGFQGVVKRFGVKILPRKQRKTRRAVGAIGGRSPKYVTRFVPRAGQMGFHYRTEYNKRIIALWNDGNVPSPKGGYVRATVPKCPAVLVSGSVMGTPKRPVILRTPARPPNYSLGAPKISLIAYAGEVLAA
jgi:large subunit ribosomal protein L3